MPHHSSHHQNTNEHPDILYSCLHLSTAADDDVPGDVVAAAKLSHAHLFISEFPEKYHTDVGESSAMVSGGQKQVSNPLLPSHPLPSLPWSQLFFSPFSSSLSFICFSLAHSLTHSLTITPFDRYGNCRESPSRGLLSSNPPYSFLTRYVRAQHVHLRLYTTLFFVTLLPFPSLLLPSLLLLISTTFCFNSMSIVLFCPPLLSPCASLPLQHRRHCVAGHVST